MTYLKRNDFERVEGGAPIRVGGWSNGRREGKVYLMNKPQKWRSHGGLSIGDWEGERGGKGTLS